MDMFAPNHGGRSSWPLVASLVAGVFFSLVALLWLPWERVHPNDSSLKESIGYAPCWSHRFGSIPGAHVDWSSLIINLLVVWVICGAAAIMLNMSAARD
jgi:hypothetical protein